jgi:hypothetical protein
MSEVDHTRRVDAAAASAQRLGVAINASPGRLRSAFRAQALRWHPDVNSDPLAHARFREVREAYRTLVGVQDGSHQMGLDPQALPMFCGTCGNNARPLRTLAVTRLRSRLLFSRSTTTHEIHCQRCAPRALLKASLVSGAFGSWSVTGLPLAVTIARQNAQALSSPGRVDLRLALHQPVAVAGHSEADTSPIPLFGAANIVAALAIPGILAALLLFKLG